ncbi:formate channel [Gammaproteobacteria bacterium]|nr:formate channel [Gammaproteobacteria bacterium]
MHEKILIMISNTPPQMSKIAADTAFYKATTSYPKMFALAIVGGVSISIAFAFCITASIGSLAYGSTKVLGGVVFSLGLILCVILGAELFTSSVLSVISRVSKKIDTPKMLKHWSVVYCGNFVGALFFVLLIFVGKSYLLADGQWGLYVLKMAQHKLSHNFMQALVLGILANLMVCVAVWMSYAGKTLTDKILVMILPVAMFVALGFEHSIANMFLIPMAIAIQYFAEPEFWIIINISPEQFSELTMLDFITKNLIPVTIGNIIGGAVFIGLTFWAIFLNKSNVK